MSAPVLEGTIGDGGPGEVLAEVEALRTSGELRFRSGSVEGVLQLIAGQLAERQVPLPDGTDPLEVFLELTDGEFSVIQRLPPLSVSHGDDRSRTGSLTVHVAADLMNYCERAGLTGVLRMIRDGRFAEAVYDRGELAAIRVDGSEDADLHEVFSWEDGTFEIEASGQVPEVEVNLNDLISERPPDELEERPRPEPTGRFLRVVEVALESIVEEREKRRSPSRTSPPLPPTPKTRSDTPRKRRREPTVRIIYLGDAEPAATNDDGSTRHVKGTGGVEAELPEALEERRSASSEPPTASKPASALAGGKAERTEGTAADRQEPGGGSSARDARDEPPVGRLAGEALGWSALLVVLLVLALAVLANLPPL